MGEERTFSVILRVEGDTLAEARNKVLRVLAKAELEGDITHFQLVTITACEKDGRR